MRYPHFSWSIYASLLLALIVAGCGDTSVDLEDQPDFNDSALRLSQPANELTLLWDPVEDVTEYRVRQTDDGPELIAGKQVVLGQTLLTVDISAYGPITLGAAEFQVEANDPEDGWISVPFVERGDLAQREIQFDWDPVEGATQYRLTQTAGRYALLPLPQQQIIYPEDLVYDRFVVPLHLFDWENSRFTLEAQVAGEWTFVGEQDTADVLTQLLIDRYSEIDPFSTQLAFGWSVALTEDGGSMAIGAIGETSVPVEQRVCPEDEPECDKDELLVIANSAGGVYAYSPLSAEVELVKSPNTDAEDLFGRDVALSDDGMTLVVSALTEDSDLTGIIPVPAVDPLSDNEEAVNSGAVYVYIRSGDAWEPQYFIKAPNTETGDLFGWDIALSGDGNTLAISAIAEDSAGNDPQDNSLEATGSVYVYTRTEGVWTQQAYLKASNADENDSFGSALAISQNGAYLAISALGEDGARGQPENNSLSQSGAVYVFARNAADEWLQVAYLKASNAGANDLFGQSVSFDASATLLAIGAPQEDRLSSGVVSVNSGVESLNTGAVYLFSRSGGGANSSFTQQNFYFKPSNASQNQQFGQAVSLSSSGDTLAVGAWGERSIAIGIGGNQDGETAPGAGAAYVFNRPSGSDSWEQVNYVKASDQLSNLYFGAKLQLADDGRLLAIAGNGVRPDSIITGFPGYVYLF